MKIPMFELPILFVIGAICALSGKVVFGKARGGLVVSTAFGFIGAFAGTLVVRHLELPELVVKVKGHPFSIVWALVGGMILVSLLHGVSRRY